MASEYMQILERLQSVTMLLPEFAGLANAIRERPFCSTDHGDTLPFVCFSGTTERVGQLLSAERAWIDYPVYVTIFTARGTALQDAAAMRRKYERREAVRRALWKACVYPTAPKVAYDPNPAWDFQGLERLFDVSIQLFTLSNSEACN